MQMINALVKAQRKNNFIQTKLKHTFILEVLTAQHTSLATAFVFVTLCVNAGTWSLMF